MRSVAKIALAAALFSCGKPPAPPPPSDDRLPPLEAAAECPPVEQFANDYFYVADLETGRSCTLYIEQDECIVGIFDDCSHLSSNCDRPRRQWRGTIDLAGSIRLEPTYHVQPATRPPAQCTGSIESSEDTSRFATLDCTGGANAHPGMFIERRIPIDDRVPFGEVDEEGQIELEKRNEVVEGHVGDVALIEDGARRELWSLVAKPESATLQGLVIDDLVAGTQDTLRIGARSRIAVTPDQTKAVIAGETELELWDVATRTVLTSSVTTEPTLAMVISGDGSRVFVSFRSPGSRFDSVLRALRLPDFTPIGEPRLFNASLDELTTTTSTTGEALLAAARLPESGFDTDPCAPLVQRGTIAQLTLDLETTYERIFDWQVSAFAPIPGTGFVGIVSQSSNAYREWDATRGAFSRVVPNPLFMWSNNVAYHAPSDRMVIAGYKSVTYMSRSDHRIQQGLVLFDHSVTHVLPARTSTAVYAVHGSVGLVDVINPANW